MSTFFVGRRPSSCTMSIVGTENVEIVSDAVCTVDPVNTTLSVAALAGDETLTLTSAVGVTTKRRYLVGDEEVTLRSISGSVASLWAPVERGHAVATPFQGLRVSYAVSGGVAAAESFDLQAVFTPDTGDEQVEVLNFVTRKIPDDLISEVDLRKLVPKSVQSISQETDMHAALRDARDELIIDLGGRQRASRLLGTDVMRRLAALRFWLDRRLEFGDAYRDTMSDLAREYAESIAQVRAGSPIGTPSGGADSPSGEGVTFGINAGWL